MPFYGDAIDWLSDRFDAGDPMRATKPPATKSSYHSMTHRHANAGEKVHGGEIMKRMDEIAGITARWYAEAEAVTASTDQVVFHEPVDIGDTLYLEARTDYVGTSSIVVHVDAYVEDHEAQERRQTTEAYYTFVALDEAGRPTTVPALEVETPEQQALYEQAKRVKSRLESA